MKIICCIILVFLFGIASGTGNCAVKNDSIKNLQVINTNIHFYDSLEVKASKHKFTKWLYGSMVCSTKSPDDKGTQSYEYYNGFKGKTIASISVRSLEVFGPTFDDTLRRTKIWIEKMANKLHSQSNMYVIRKNLWIKEGQTVDPDLFMDNENLMRSLPYLKDVRFIIIPRPLNPDLVDVLVLTQDVFSFGVDGSLGSVNRGKIGIYDKNILGVGHEISTTIYGHTDLTPHLGFESFYSVNNVMGKFINFSTGYANTYLREGFMLKVDRDFLRPQSVNAGELSIFRSLRYDRMNYNDQVISKNPLNYITVDSWYGRKLDLGINENDKRFQMTLAARVRYTHFYDRPLPDINNQQFFSNSTFYLGSISFSHRSYIQDHLVYSYGITEDIPKGYLHELVFGYEDNEFGNRWYSHLFLSTGNIFRNKPFYLFSSLGVGSFFNHTHTEQGIVDFKIDFVSQLFNIWNVKARQFIKLNYTLGFNRFDIENLLLRNDYGIRGFSSQIGKGKQRLSLNIENVFFQKKAILNFQSAFFSFIDLGLIGPSSQSIFQQKYYAGLGIGLRIRNENLVFKTIQLRLAFYPNHPSDVSDFGFVLDGVSKNRFYSFQPRGPEPLPFQ